MYAPIDESDFDAGEIGYNTEGNILYDEKRLFRRFEGIYEKNVNGTTHFTILNPEWISIHKSIIEKLKSANITLTIFEIYKTDSELYLSCFNGTIVFPYYDSDLKEGCKITGIIGYTRYHNTRYETILSLVECHKCDYPVSYSWGELYETLKEMDEKGDSVEDPLFRRILNLFPRLEISSFTEVQRILRSESFTETELNRINSSCLDGLVACMHCQLTRFEKIYENSYTETYKFCLDKGMPLDNFLNILIEYGNKKILQIYLDRGGKIPGSGPIGCYAHSTPFYYYVKYGKILSVELCEFLVDNNMTGFNELLFEAFLYRENKIMEERTLEIVKFFLTKELLPKYIDFYNFIQEGKYNVVKLLIQYGTTVNFDIKQLICTKNLTELFEESFKTDKTWDSNQLNIACKYNSFEIVKKMIEFGIKGDAYTLGQACMKDFRDNVNLLLIKCLLENRYDTLPAGNYSTSTLNFLLENNVKIDNNFIRSVCLTCDESLIRKLVDKKVCIDEILKHMLPNASFIKILVETQLREQYDFVEKKRKIPDTKID